ncbi:MAG: motility-associated protein [Ignavibacteriota bacterium]
MGKLLVLLQPAELVIILGAALGTVLIANPPATLRRMFRAMLSVFGRDRRNASFYLENLKMLHELFAHARRSGMARLEADVDDPSSSQVFGKYPKFLKDEHMTAFVCDTLRTYISGGVDPYELDQMMEIDMEGPSCRETRTGGRADHDRRFVAGLGHCSGRARRGDHHGRTGRSSRGRSGGKWRRPWWGRSWAF